MNKPNPGLVRQLHHSNTVLVRNDAGEQERIAERDMSEQLRGVRRPPACIPRE
jgi:hypothetical protein